VIFPGCKGPDTISMIERVDVGRYKILCEGIIRPSMDNYNTEVTYLGNKKKEKIMKEQKVDYSALYPYFDSLANDEVTLKHTNIPTHVKQQLKNIYELFEGVLDLTLEEVKTLYFERKISKSKESSRTKLVKDLCIGDKVFLSLSYDGYEGEETIIKLQEFSDTQIRIITDQDTEAIFRKDKIVTLID
jgi:hypothetical protein